MASPEFMQHASAIHILRAKFCFFCRYYINLNEKTTTWEDPRRFRAVHIPLQVLVLKVSWKSRTFQYRLYFHLQQTTNCVNMSFMCHPTYFFLLSILNKIETPINPPSSQCMDHQRKFRSIQRKIIPSKRFKIQDITWVWTQVPCHQLEHHITIIVTLL